MKFPPIPRTVLITGCSSGIGLASAQMLKERGWQVFASARKATDVDRLQHEGFEALELDVADSDSVAAAIAAIRERTNGTLGAVVNNAGFGQPGALEDISREALHAQYAVNVFGLHDVTRACIPIFRAQGSGRVINISSVVGRVALPFLGAYASSKFAVEALSDALRVEVRSSGIAVSIVEPGPIITAFRANAVDQTQAHIDTGTSRFGSLMQREITRRKRSQKTVDFINRPPQDVGRKIIHALESARPHRRYCVTLPAYAGTIIRRCLPYAIVDAILASRVARMQQDG